MKLATYRDGSRDGQLIVVSRDLTTAHYATHAAHTLQHVLDDWNFISPQLQDLYAELNHGKGRHVFPFDPALCMAPLPRTGQCVRAVAYTGYADFLRQARRATDGAPASTTDAGDTAACAKWLQLSGDALWGATDEVVWADDLGQLDFEAGWAAFTSDVPAGCTPLRALEAVRLLALANTWALRGLADAAQTPGVSALQSRPGVAFSPVVVTPDELGDAWVGGRLHGVLQTSRNGHCVATTDAAAHMTLHMGQLLALLAAHRPVRAGSVLCTGPVSARADAALAGEEADRPARGGGHSVQAQRAMEVLQTGHPVTRYLAPGDTVRIDMAGRDGLSVFGAIDQTVHAAVA